jgi:hypothetical protein
MALNFSAKNRNAQPRHFVRFDQCDDRCGLPLLDSVEVCEITR